MPVIICVTVTKFDFGFNSAVGRNKALPKSGRQVGVCNKPIDHTSTYYLGIDHYYTNLLFKTYVQVASVCLEGSFEVPMGVI